MTLQSENNALLRNTHSCRGIASHRRDTSRCCPCNIAETFKMKDSWGNRPIRPYKVLIYMWKQPAALEGTASNEIEYKKCLRMYRRCVEVWSGRAMERETLNGTRVISENKMSLKRLEL